MDDQSRRASPVAGPVTTGTFTKRKIRFLPLGHYNFIKKQGYK